MGFFFSVFVRPCCYSTSGKPCMCVFLDDPDPEGQGFCQAGFSVDFTKVRISICHLWCILCPCQRTNADLSANVRLRLEINERREDESTSPEEPPKWPITSEHNTPNTHLHVHSFTVL